MSRDILIVLGSRGCVSIDPLEAARDLGYRITLFAPRPPTRGAELVDRVEPIHLDRADEAVELARKFHAEQPISGVLGYEEDGASLAARIAAELGLPAHPVAAAEAAMDKPTMKDRFAAAGVPTADYHLAADEDDAVRWANDTGYPVIVKPCRGGASQGVIRADNESDLRTAYRRLYRIVRDHGLDNGGRPDSAHLVERYLAGDEISVELVLQRGQAQTTAIFEKPCPLTGPFFEEAVYLTPARLDPGIQAEAEQLAVRAAAALGLWHGPAHCEIRLTDHGMYVLEIAGRLLGAACARTFRDRLGGDIHPMLLRLAMGEPVTIPAPDPAAPIAAAAMLPIPGNGRLAAIHGVDRARRVPGIRDVILASCPGDMIVQFPEQSCYPIGLLTASGPTYEAVEDALTWASASISVVLTPTSCDRWARGLGPDDVEYRPPAGAEVTMLADLPPREGRRLAVSYLAAIMFGELPRDDAVRIAGRNVAWEEEHHGPLAGVLLPGEGMMLGFVDRDTGNLSCGGVLPERRRRGTGTVLLRALLADFARRGCTRAVSETNPTQPLFRKLLRRHGFTHREDLLAGPAKAYSCAIAFGEQPLDEPAVVTSSCCEC